MAKAIIFHIETTGLEPCYGHTITEVGAYKIDTLDLLNSRGQANSIHVTANEKTRRIAVDELKSLSEFIGALPLICFNVNFHQEFIVGEMQAAGIQLNNEWHCVMEMAIDALPDAPSHKLLDLTATMQPHASLPSSLQKAQRTLALFAALS